MNTTRPVLSLADLRDFDPRGGQGPTNGQRWLCPLCGNDKPKDSAHRCLSADANSGAWNCKRCGASGKLREFWTDRPAGAQAGAPYGAHRMTPNQAKQKRLRRAFDIEAAPAPKELNEDWKAETDSAVPLIGAQGLTPGAAYLQRRGISPQVAEAGAPMLPPMFCQRFYQRPAVLWPLIDFHGRVVGAHGRYIDGRDTPKARTVGDKSAGVVWAPVWLEATAHLIGPLDTTAPAVIVTEAPIDALSLAAAGFPAIALCGTSGPAWLHRACGLRRVFLAFDDDLAGERGAESLAAKLTPYGARCDRLRPDGFKDWNEMLLQIGAPALADWLAFHIFDE